MTVAITRPEPFFFGKADWPVDKRGAIASQPPPGSWYDIEASPLKHMFRRMGASALYCCPLCKGVRALTHAHHKIAKDGKVSMIDGTPIECGIGCEFRRECYFLKWADKTLYAFAIERLIDGKMTPMMRYTHGKDEAEARKNIIIRPCDKLVACAPVIGYYVEDKVGNVLNVD